MLSKNKYFIETYRKYNPVIKYAINELFYL